MARPITVEVEEKVQDILGNERIEVTTLLVQDIDPVFSEMVEIMVGRAKKHEIEGLKDVIVFSPSIFHDKYRIYGDLMKLVVKEIDIKLPSTHAIKDNNIYNIRFDVTSDIINAIV